MARDANAKSALPYPALINADPPHPTGGRRLLSPLMTPETLAPLETYRTQQLTVAA